MVAARCVKAIRKNMPAAYRLLLREGGGSKEEDEGGTIMSG